MTAVELAQWQKYVAEPKYREALLAAVKRQNDTLPSSCPNATFVLMDDANIIQPPHFDATGTPTQGAWMVHFNTGGCAAKLRLNMLAIVQPQKDPRFVALLAGTTRADPFLQRDALLYANSGTMLLKPKDCTEAQVIDTAFVAFEGAPLPNMKPGRDPRPWVESWTVASCGVLITVPIHFEPNSTGTGIRQRPGESKLK
jgi:hypothetical protein